MSQHATRQLTRAERAAFPDSPNMLTVPVLGDAIRVHTLIDAPVSRHTSLAKEDPDRNASARCTYCGRAKGLVFLKRWPTRGRQTHSVSQLRRCTTPSRYPSHWRGVHQLRNPRQSTVPCPGDLSPPYADGTMAIMPSYRSPGLSYRLP
jgi:hypothetical protein